MTELIGAGAAVRPGAPGLESRKTRMVGARRIDSDPGAASVPATNTVEVFATGDVAGPIHHAERSIHLSRA